MGQIVPFSYPGLIAQFPEFQNVDQATAQSWFTVAGATICRNDGGGPVSNMATATVLMNFATAHLIMLFAAQVNGQPDTESGSAIPSPNVVGRINSATEGSVTISTEMPQPPSGTAAWWLQTKYGAAFWQMTSPYRTMRYLPGPQRYFGPVYGGGGFAPFAGGFGGPFFGGSVFIGINGGVLF